MAITLVRVDDRVVHGQTVTRWAASKKVNGILVISDKVAADELRKKVLKMAAGNLKLGIYTVEQGVGALEKANASDKYFFVITDSLNEFAKLKRAGGDFGNLINIGNLSSTRPGMVPCGGAICLIQEDIDAYEYLKSQGIKVEVQMTPEDGTKDFADYVAKFQKA